MFAGLLDNTKSFQVYDSISSYCIVNCGLSLLHDFLLLKNQKRFRFIVELCWDIGH